MIQHYSERNRSLFCHLITDFHSASQKRLARFDILGVTTLALVTTVLVAIVRLLVSR
jgi:hypothetical protein